MEHVNKYTGEVLPFATSFSYNDDVSFCEKNSGEYVVDDTGYIPLEQQIERCFRDGRIKEFADGMTDEEVFNIDEDGDNEELPTDGAESPTTVGDASSEVAVDNSSVTQTEEKQS